MTKYEIWRDLVKQTRQARKERNEKEGSITACDWNNPEKSCIKVIQVQSLGVPSEDNTKFEVLTKPCEEFDRQHTCINVGCPMREANADYVLANLKFRTIRADRNRAFWNMFVRSK